MDIGRTFLDRLGLENTCTGHGMYDAAFELPGTDCRYEVSLMDRTMLQIIPLSGGEATDALAAVK